MKRFFRSFFFIVICFASIFVLNGCREKGCTNPAAINYNSAADEDDGSCVVCQSHTEDVGVQTAGLFDNNFSSLHQNQTVAVFHVKQQRLTYNNTLCGTSNSCTVVISIQSLVNERMQIPFYGLQCNGPLNFFYNDFISVEGHQTIELTTLDELTLSNPCGDINASSLSAFLNGSINYVP